MSFSVDPLALNAYAAQLARARDDAQQCKSHFETFVPDFKPSDGFLNLLNYEHSRVRVALGAMLDQAITVLSASRDEMALAATDYRKTDAENATRLDATYPQVPRATPRRD